MTNNHQTSNGSSVIHPGGLGISSNSGNLFSTLNKGKTYVLPMAKPDDLAAMQTVQVILMNGKGKLQTATGLIDCGCSKSYITTAMAKSLNLEIGDQEIISTATFGTQNTTNLTTRKAKFLMNLKTHPVQNDALEIYV